MESKSNNSWDIEYKMGRLGGKNIPEYALLKFFEQIPKGKILDLGGGDGRNSMLFAKNDFDVMLVDSSKIAIQNCNKKSELLKTKIKTSLHNIEDYNIAQSRYSLIISSLVLQAFKQSISEKIISQMIQGVRKHGFLYVSVLSTKDSAFEKRKSELDEVEKNTFYLKDRDIYCHHFTTKELLNYFSNLEMIYFSESKFQRTGEYGHKFPYQATIEYLGRKTF